MDNVALLTLGNSDRCTLVVSTGLSPLYVLRRLMRHSSLRGERIAIVATVLGTILLLVAGYLVLRDGSEDPVPALPQAPKVSLQPTQPPRDEVPDSFEKFFEGANGGGLTATGDPLKLAGTGSIVYNVTITLTSDGPMRYVYRFHDGDTPVRTANGRTSITRKLRGPRAVAQGYVQRMEGATYASCSITIDGVVVDTNTARKLYQVTACTG